MNSYKHISTTVDSWIVEEELPVRANLKVIKQRDPDYGLSEDEIADRNEFIRCYLLREFRLLIAIPKQDTMRDFFIPDCDVSEPEYSAFNTHDFQRSLRPFNKYGYALQKIMERVKDLAILHSSISSPQGRLETYRRYEAFADREFRNRLLGLTERYKRIEDDDKKAWLKQKIAELNRRILECKRLWERYAPPENWDY